MRSLYQILIFLILFNVMLTVFSPYFPGTSQLKEDENNPITGDDNLREYEGVADAITVLSRLFATWETIAIFGAIIGIGGFIAKITGGSINIALLLGIGVLIATLMAVWNTVADTFSNLNYTNNPEIKTLFIIVNICIGIMLVFTIVDLLTGQQGAESA